MLYTRGDNEEPHEPERGDCSAPSYKDHVTGRILSKPLALALAHHLASALITSSRSTVEGQAPSKMIAFLFFQMG